MNKARIPRKIKKSLLKKCKELFFTFPFSDVKRCRRNYLAYVKHDYFAFIFNHRIFNHRIFYSF